MSAIFCNTNRAKNSNTHHLNNGEVFLPPEVLLHLRSQSCQAVVTVHEDVDGRVDGCTEKCCGKRHLDQKPWWLCYLLLECLCFTSGMKTRSICWISTAGCHNDKDPFTHIVHRGPIWCRSTRGWTWCSDGRRGGSWPGWTSSSGWKRRCPRIPLL